MTHANAHAACFIDGMFGAGSLNTFQTFHDSRKGLPATIVHGAYDAIESVLMAKQVNGHGVFITVNETDCQGRTRENVTRVRCVWLDLDKDGAAKLARAVGLLIPHAVIESSPGKFHVYWKVSDCSLEEFDALLKAITTALGGDPDATGLNRVLRLPGFTHLKGEPFVSHIVNEFWRPDMAAYTVGQLRAALLSTTAEVAPSTPVQVVAAVAHDASDEWATKTPAQRILALEHLRSALTYWNPDDRVEWVNAGHALVGLEDEGHALWVEFSARSTRFPGGDDLEKWDTFKGRRTSYGAIFAKAETRGWVNPARGVRPALPNDASAVFSEAAAAPAGMVTEAPASRQASVEVETFEYSDDALAQIFVERHPEIRWVPGIGWMRDNGQILEADDGLKRFDLVRSICRASAASPLVTAPAERKRIASTKTVSAVLTMAQSSVVVHSRDLDNDSLVLNTPGGIVELRTGFLRLRRADEFFTQIAGVAPAADAHPVWDKFLWGVSCGDAAWIDFLQRSMGYWATGDRREQHLWFLYGRGANGKSVLLDFVKWIFGSYAHKLPASALMTPKAERHPTELAGLRGKRLVVSSELDEGAYFNESLLKELTGDQTLTARFMRGDFFEFDMTHKHVIVGNFRPRLRGGDPAMARRMLLVPFNATFQGAQRDREILAKLKAEAPAILAWIVEGARKWHESGLAIPASVRDASAEYIEEHDDTALWLSECCSRDTSASTSAATLYASFRNWKTARGEHAPSQTAWGPRLTQLPGVEKRKSHGVFVYAGIGLKVGFGVGG